MPNMSSPLGELLMKAYNGNETIRRRVSRQSESEVTENDGIDHGLRWIDRRNEFARKRCFYSAGRRVNAQKSFPE